jgi:hypothetical protein
MILKTLEGMGPLHGYGIARRIEQTRGDLLAVKHALPCPAETRAGGLQFVRVGLLGQQSKGEILQADACGAEASRKRNAKPGRNDGDHRLISRAGR